MNYYIPPLFSIARQNLSYNNMLFNYNQNQMLFQNIPLNYMGGKSTINFNDNKIKENGNDLNSNLSNILSEDLYFYNINKKKLNKYKMNFETLYRKKIKEINDYYESVDNFLNSPSLACYYYCYLEKTQGDFDLWNSRVKRWAENRQKIKINTNQIKTKENKN